MRAQIVPRVVTKLFIPFVLMFALYVQFHGDYGPGGGFQAGVTLAAAIILYALIFGLPNARRVMPPWLVEAMIALGVLIFGAVGVAGMLRGEEFLDYSVLSADAVAGQHLGILLVEAGVCVTVAGVMLMIFYLFAGRGRRPS
ncbi:MAG: Na(+)/H(+) antiporter subunit B [Gammaproteobacteria bacterium]|nr:Na(+)/H(+) antiporter subunit B [Gammaproteobacteria bacterium]